MEETTVQAMRDIVELQKEQAAILEKIGKDKKTIDNINENIEGLKKIRKELKKNSDTSKDTLNENRNAIQKLRNERVKATANMLSFFDTIISKSQDAVTQAAKIYELLGADDTRMKSILERERDRIKMKGELTDEDKARVKELNLEIVGLEKYLKKNEQVKKTTEAWVNIAKDGSTAIENILGSMMKFGSFPGKSKDGGSGGGLTAGSADAEAEDGETEEEKTERIKINHEERLESVMAYAEAAKTAITDLDNLWDSIDEARMLKKQKQYDDDVLEQKELLANGVINEEQYNAKIIELDKNLSKEKAKIEREEAIRKKATAIFKVAMDTAVAIMKVWVEAPLWGAIPLTVAITALAAAQMAAIAAAPLPKARKGGIIVGNSHENGGVIIEAEGGEAILSKNAVSAFPGMVALMNAAAENGYIHDGGYAARSIIAGSGDYYAGGRGVLNEVDYQKLAEAVVNGMEDLKFYVAVTDINDGLKRYAKIDNMAKL